MGGYKVKGQSGFCLHILKFVEQDKFGIYMNYMTHVDSSFIL